MNFNVLCLTVILVCFTQKFVMGGTNEDIRILVSKLSQIIKGLSDRVADIERSVKGIQTTINKNHKVETQIINTRLNEIDNEISSTKNKTIKIIGNLEDIAGIKEIRGNSVETLSNNQTTLNKALEKLIIISHNATRNAMLTIVNDVQAVMNSTSHTKLNSDLIKKHMKQFDDKLELLNSTMSRIEFNISSNFAPSVSSGSVTCKIDSNQLGKLNESVSLASNDDNILLKTLLRLVLGTPMFEITLSLINGFSSRDRKTIG